MSQPQFDFRFHIGSSPDHRSSTWRVWAHKSSVYLAIHGVSQHLKVSLHDGGLCLLALTKELAEIAGGEHNLPGASRRHQSWTRPTFVADDLAIPIEIHIPASELSRVTDRPSKKPSVRLPAPPRGYSASFLLAFGTGAPEATRFDAGTAVVFSAVLPNGETLWLLHQCIQTIPDISKAIATRRSELQTSQPGFVTPGSAPRTDPEARFLLPGTSNIPGRRVLVEASLVAVAG